MSSIPRPEHPRPDFMRQPWLNLNGRWRFTFDPQNAGEQKRWHRYPHPDVAISSDPPGSDPFRLEIIVPFPWESPLSEIGQTDYKGAAWYQRSFQVPAEWGDSSAASDPTDVGDLKPASINEKAPANWKRRPVLCFGAVDWSARVWIDGRFVGEHYGGYTPFDFDISDYVRPGRASTIVVRAWDVCDADTPIGKQTEDWYTHSGGIWQTVWLEGRTPAHIKGIRYVADLESGRVQASITAGISGHGADKQYTLQIVSSKDEFPPVEQSVVFTSETLEIAVTIEVPDFQLWSPERPHLYDCVVRLVAPNGDMDEVTSYFGMRSIGKGKWGDNAFEYVLLNGRPVYLRGALDQAFHPEGLHTYPTDDAIKSDIQAAKDLGLNLLRCHIKVNEPRYYYWADRLGMLIMYDLPSASVYTPTARGNWKATFLASLDRDFSHPCIIVWILFNETWGLEEHETTASWNWVREMFDLAKFLDPTRLIEDNSACLYDHVISDINTWHFYISDYDRARRHVNRIVAQTYEGSPFNYVGQRFPDVPESSAFMQGIHPLINSEYAGLGASGGDKDISYTFKFLTSELRRHSKICGYVYTELADIEWEHNGLLNYDRTAKEFGYDHFFPGMHPADINGADFLGFDCPPCRTMAPGDVFTASLFISHWSDWKLQDAPLHWKVTFTDRFAASRVLDEGCRTVDPTVFSVTDAGTIETVLPNEPGLLTVAIWLDDRHGITRARNYVNVDVHLDAAAPTNEAVESGMAIHFCPGDFSDSSSPTPTLGPGGCKFGLGGTGWVEYTLALPDCLDLANVTRIRFLGEVSARTASRRFGWKRFWRGSITSYPQTEARKIPSTVNVSINGMAIGSLALPDDPADSTGVLSAHLSENFEFASYGFLKTLTVEGDVLHRIIASMRDNPCVLRFETARIGTAGGLNLYGKRMGAWPIDPTLFFDR